MTDEGRDAFRNITAQRRRDGLAVRIGSRGWFDEGRRFEHERWAAVRDELTAAVAELRAALARFALEPDDEALNGGEDAPGCVYCGGHPHGRPWDDATEHKHHRPGCQWLQARAVLGDAAAVAQIDKHAARRRPKGGDR